MKKTHIKKYGPKFEAYIQSKIKRKYSFLYNAFTISRIFTKPSKEVSQTNLSLNGINQNIQSYENEESISIEIDVSEHKELEYSDEFKNFIQTLPNESNILK